MKIHLLPRNQEQRLRQLGEARADFLRRQEDLQRHPRPIPAPVLILRRLRSPR